MKPRQRQLEALLKTYTPTVRYDDGAGLARLRENIAQNTAAPAWAARVPRPRRFVWWPLTLIGIALLAWPRAEPMAERAPAKKVVVEPVALPTVEQLPASVVQRAPVERVVREETTTQVIAPPVAKPPRARTVVKHEEVLPVPPVEPAPPPTPDVIAQTEPQDLLEMQEVARAERLLARDPRAALALVRAGNERYPRGYFRVERRYVEILALVKLGERDPARAAAWSFFQDYPRSPYRRRIEDALRTAAFTK